MFPWKKIVFSGETNAPTFCALVYKYGLEHMRWDVFVQMLKVDAHHTNKLVRSMASAVLFYIYKILVVSEVDKSIDKFFGEILEAIPPIPLRRSTRLSCPPLRYTPI